MTAPQSEPLTHPDQWTETFAEACMQFLQVNYRLHSSRWARCWGPNGSSIEPLPDVEALTLPLLLLRQLVSSDDQLFCTVKHTYCACLPASQHAADVESEYRITQTKLNQKTPTLQCCTNRELLDAIIYGTFLFHAPSKVKEGPRQTIANLQTQDNADVLHGLNYAIKAIWHHADVVATILNTDLTSWIRNKSILAPQVCMFDKIFRIDDFANKWIQAIL